MAGRPITQDEPERAEAGNPVVRVVQTQLPAGAGDLPVGRELDEGELEQPLHLFREQHGFLLATPFLVVT